MLVPSISAANATRALEVLQRLRLLTRNAEGKLERSEALVSTGDQTRSVHMLRFHREMLECATRSLEELGPGAREVSGVTLCVGKEGLERLKAATRAFRRELIALELREQDPVQVFHVNVSVFPLSRESE